MPEHDVASEKASPPVRGDKAVLAAPDLEPADAIAGAQSLAGLGFGTAASLPQPSELRALQRAAGNRAVARLARRAVLARAPKTIEAEKVDDGGVPELPKVEVLPEVRVAHRKYVCVFVGQDTYGRGARDYARVVMSDHTLIDVRSLDAAVAAIVKDAAKAKGPVHIDEIVLIAHANDRGFIAMPLYAGAKGTTVSDLARLQQQFHKGARTQFSESRAQLLDMLTSRTKIIMRGCRAGRDGGLVYALTAFFGGQPTVYVAKDYQAFTAMKAGTSDEELAAAYDHLIDQGMPSASVYETADKASWMRKQLPSGWVPEAFFVRDEDVATVRKAKKGDTSIEDLKHFDDSQSPEVSDRWATGPTDWQDRDFSFEGMSADAVLAQGTEHLAALRRLEAGDPGNWIDIGLEAWSVLRAHREWMRRPEATESLPGAEGDPLGGFSLTMRGLSYDTNVLAKQAGRREDLRISYRDAFEAVDIQAPLVPAPTVTDEDEDLEAKPAEPGQIVAYKRRPGDRVRKPRSPLYVFKDDTIHSLPAMPQTPIVVPQDEHDKAEYALCARGEFKRTFEFKYDPPRPIAGGWLYLKKSELTFAGQLDFKGEGKKEILVGALGSWSSKAGDRTFGAASKGEVTLASKKSDSGFTAKAKGGVEIGGIDKKKDSEGAQSDRGMKAEIYLSGEVGWGPVSTEVKITVIGLDETKSVSDQVASGTGPFKILAIKWSPLIVTGGPLEIPLTDGTKAVFNGKASLAFEAEPNWPRILAKVGELMGREAVVAEGAAVAGGGGAITTGLAAVGAGELIIAGGFVAGAALTLYAFYKSVEEIESLKALAEASNSGWDDFYNGFMTELGVPMTMKTKHGPLYAEGARHAKVVLAWRVKSAAVHLNDLHPDLPQKFTDDDPEVREYLVGIIRDHKDQWGRACAAAYENVVRTSMYHGWQRKVGPSNAEHDDLNARARAQLRDLRPSDDPDYDWLKY
jgi:hypothetical protein